MALDKPVQHAAPRNALEPSRRDQIPRPRPLVIDAEQHAAIFTRGDPKFLDHRGAQGRPCERPDDLPRMTPRRIQPEERDRHALRRLALRPRVVGEQERIELAGLSLAHDLPPDGTSKERPPPYLDTRATVQ
jgi:hypothetical protein